MNLIFSEYQGAFETLLNSCDKLVMLFDINTKKIKYVNDAFCKAFNVVRDKTIGRSISKFLPSNNGRLEAIVEEIETNGKYVSNFYYSPMETNISLELKYLEYPGHKDIIAHFRPEKDETLKNKIKKLKDVIEKEYEMIDAFKKAYSFVYYIELDTEKYFVINRESINDFSLQYEGFISKKTIESLFSHVSEPYKELVDEFIDSSTLKDRLKDRDKINEEFISDIEGWCRIGFIVCERDENNNASKVLFTYRVINDAKNREISMQNAVKDALDSVKKANDIKTEFLSRMGHDIKTPLNSIIGMASIAKANSTNPEKVEQSLKKIMDASHQLTKLFSEVLDMSNIEAGNITFTKEEIEISDLFTNLINANKEGILSHHHKITIKNSGVKHEHILGDKTKLQQIFNNILVNAIEYTHDFGMIDITINEKSEGKDSKISTYEFIFEDNGIGMNESFISKAFEPFERENRKDIISIDGAGLGLSIASSFVQRMGGDIKISSRVNEGTKVSVSLSFEFVPKMKKDCVCCKNINILLISNNKPQVEDVAKNIKAIGARCSIAKNANEAIDLLKDAHAQGKDFTYIFSTWMTPTMSGIEIINTIKEKYLFPLPKIAFAHYDLERIEEEANSIGVTDLVKLPLSKCRLLHFFNHLSGNDGDPLKNKNNRSNKKLKGKKVLIVEDNDLNREILREFLEMRAIDIYEACDGKEALDIFMDSEEYFFDLILMDIQMPVMNGYESTMSIRGLDRDDGKRIPIIAMSASNFADDINASIIAGMNDHVAKPLNYDTLNNSIEKWFNGEYASRKQLELKAETDIFTNVLNKVATFERMHKFLMQDEVPLSAMMIVDLDNFKKVNDRLGHKEGDQVIKETTKVLKDLFRNNDIIGRFGGDEFIIFMKNISSESIAIERANKIISNIAKKFVNRYVDIKLTASVGLAFVDKKISEEELFDIADHSLYKAKNSGKNQIFYTKVE